MNSPPFTGPGSDAVSTHQMTRTNGEPTEPEVADRTDADAASDAIVIN